jgi:hypothetical protein
MYRFPVFLGVMMGMMGRCMAVQSQFYDADNIRFCRIVSEKRVRKEIHLGDDVELLMPCNQDGNLISDYTIPITRNSPNPTNDEISMTIGRYSWCNHCIENKGNRFSDHRGFEILEYLKSKPSALWSDIKKTAKSSVLGKCVNRIDNLKYTNQKDGTPMMISRLDITPMDYAGHNQKYDKAEHVDTLTVLYQEVKEYCPVKHSVKIRE